MISKHIWHVYREDGFLSWHRSLDAAKRMAVKAAKRTGLTHWVVPVRGGYSGV